MIELQTSAAFGWREARNTLSVTSARVITYASTDAGWVSLDG